MPRLMASRTSSGGVQWLTGSPLSRGDSQASAMMSVICSAENRQGAPLRGSSVSTFRIRASRSLSDASASAAARRSLAASQRRRHRRTRCRSTLNRCPWSSSLTAASDRSTTWARSANCCGVFLPRTISWSTIRCRSVTVAFDTGLGPRFATTSSALIGDLATLIPNHPRSNCFRIASSAEDI
jgi:hypothetical protein